MDRGDRFREHEQEEDVSDLLREDVIRIQASGGPDVGLQGPGSPLKRLREVATSVRDAVEALRHIVAEPRDAAAQMCGGLVSKEYGAHEPAHTEHHLYRGGGPGAPLPPGAPPGAAARVARGGGGRGGDGGGAGGDGGGAGGNRKAWQDERPHE